MKEFKCKACGAPITVADGAVSAVCSYCEKEQTVPVIIDNDKLAMLHNRANSLRLKNLFDKAVITYENIINENPNDAEAHWGLLLCRYGIEYVDDKRTNRKIPTCHRTQLKSIFDDIDYKAAIENSDVIAQRIYQEEAEEIDKIQKEILMISQKNEPCDIFICYKETDSDGKRTRDSVIAQEIYDVLNDKGYRVFFSRISLETIPGSKYEPYIYAALSTAKVMLVLGTKPEYFEAVWVKNEWSRFIDMMNDTKQKRYIVPCYRDMDVYELPEELSLFQAQDMNKLGFIQDLVRGIDKIFERNVKKQVVEQNQTSSNASNSNVSSKLRRVEILISDNDYTKAKDIIENILNSDPENAKAYFCLMLIDLSLTEASELKDYPFDISTNKNFQKALKFADADYEKELIQLKDMTIKNGVCKKHYDAAIICINKEDYNKAIIELEAADDFLDAKELLNRIQNLDQSFKEVYDEAKKLYEEGNVKEAYELLSTSHLDAACRDLFKKVNESYKELLKKDERKKRLLLRKEVYQKEIQKYIEEGYADTVRDLFPSHEVKLGLFAKNKIKNGLYSAKIQLYNNNYNAACQTLLELGYEVEIIYDGNGGLVKLIDHELLTKNPKPLGRKLVVDKYDIAENNKAKINIKVEWTKKLIDNKILFGEYPQTKKRDDVKIISATPDEDGYYLGSDGKRYAKAIAAPAFNVASDYPDDFVKGEAYYFMVEPIVWNVVKTNNSKYAELVTKKVIDTQRYSSNIREYEVDGKVIKPNNYKYSEVRTWLNNDFIKKAFNQYSSTFLEFIEVDNSIKSTYNNNDNYPNCVCENTVDKVTLPCAADGMKAKRPTDYARAKGAHIYMYESEYMLRTPFPNVIDKCCTIGCKGEPDNTFVFAATCAVTPKICIDIDELLK